MAAQLPSSSSTTCVTIGSRYATRLELWGESPFGGDGCVQNGRDRSPGRNSRDGWGLETDVRSMDGPRTTSQFSGCGVLNMAGLFVPPPSLLMRRRGTVDAVVRAGGAAGAGFDKITDDDRPRDVSSAR
jgi:hypothetical protein